MKIYNQTNFFKHTFCEFQQVENFEFPKENYFKSKSDSYYFYADEGVYRKSNHWRRVANCKWKIITNSSYKNQKEIIGFAKWTDFYSINSDEKLFYISVDFDLKVVSFHHQKEEKKVFLFYISEAQKRVKQIRKLLSEEKWSTYFDLEIDKLRFKIITELINSNKTLQEIKSRIR